MASHQNERKVTVECQIYSPHRSYVEHEVDQIQDDVYLFQYTPTTVGNHEITVTANNT